LRQKPENPPKSLAVRYLIAIRMPCETCLSRTCMSLPDLDRTQIIPILDLIAGRGRTPRLSTKYVMFFAGSDRDTDHQSSDWLAWPTDVNQISTGTIIVTMAVKFE
jgi:hypothetical protein